MKSEEKTGPDTTVVPFLVVEGSHELLLFLERVFEAKIVRQKERSDGTVALAEVQVGKSVVVVAESSEERPARPASLRISTDDLEQDFERAVAAGAEALVRPGTSDEEENVGVVADKLGNHWYLVGAEKEV